MSAPCATTRLPPEWAPQQAVLLAWPRAAGDFGADLAAAEAELATLARHIAARQGVRVVVPGAVERSRAVAALERAGAGGVQLSEVPCDDIWIRDYGPLTTVDDAGGGTLVDYRFNGWGGKYPAARDDAVTAALHEAGTFDGIRLAPLPFVVEGGNIEVDGHGGLLANRRCLLDPLRNPPESDAALLDSLQQHLGVQRVMLVDCPPLPGDDTDGHIDTLARFCAPDLIAWTAPARGRREPLLDSPLEALREQLAALRTAAGTPYRLLALPLPDRLPDHDGDALPANYANFLIVNGAVLVPAYGDPADARACTALAGAFPQRDIIAVPAAHLIRQRGGPHCASMQIPRTSPERNPHT